MKLVAGLVLSSSIIKLLKRGSRPTKCSCSVTINRAILHCKIASLHYEIAMLIEKKQLRQIFAKISSKKHELVVGSISRVNNWWKAFCTVEEKTSYKRSKRRKIQDLLKQSFEQMQE